MYPPPTGPELDANERKRLDTDFYTSDPTAFFWARIDAILEAESPAVASARPSTASRVRFEEIVGESAEAKASMSAVDRQRQAAIDAVAIRHQAAEALLRLLLARLLCRASTTPKSLWLELVRTPTNVKEVLKAVSEYVNADGFGNVLAGLILPVPDGTALDEQAIRAVQNTFDWIARAEALVSTGEIDLSAAANKIKHGVAARPNDRLRAVLTLQPPNDDGTISLSAVTGDSAIDIVNGVVLEYVSRPPKSGGVYAGYERTLLRTDIPSVLAETWMLALIHGAILYTSAYRDNGDQAVDAIPAHPGVALGPTPEQVLGQAIVGLRFPVTTSPDGSVQRTAGMQLTDGTFVPMQFGATQSGVIVEG